MPRQGLLKHDDLPYRPCVGIMLINNEGLVFVGRRIDQTVEGWQMPQGGIDDGETPEQAALRELEEETGTNKATIIAQMSEVAASQDKVLAALTDDLVLLDCGLDSLCFAILVAQLEDELGFDPFTASEDAYFPVTFGDFVTFYEAGAHAHAA